VTDVIGSGDRPLRVAVVGSGPAGFYVVEHLLRQDGVAVEVDLFDRLPTPFGLVRFGVAPDHQKIKNVIRVFDRLAGDPRVRFFGNVHVGRDLELSDLSRHYHQVCLATGAETDRHMGIPGESLGRSYAATEFVAWYNGHPDYRDRRFDLSVERVAIVGVGNVAVDVARILCRTTDELATTDIADYALDALAESRVREVFLLGRRGPAQAAFTTPEVKELGELPGADVTALPEETALDPLSQEAVTRAEDRQLTKKTEILQEFARRPTTGKPRRLTLRFLVSPVELIADGDGNVGGMQLVRNELHRASDGGIRSRATRTEERLQVGMVFRSVGYRGVAIPGAPFDPARGVVPNEAGRVIAPETRRPIPGLYVAGWIKRGPTGVIGTNKPDAAETVEHMVTDAGQGACSPAAAAAALGRHAVEGMVRERQPRLVTYDDWRRLDRHEVDRGAPSGRPRVKLTSVEEMLRVLER
jgi:ferredoxin--NADP+ reductase